MSKKFLIIVFKDLEYDSFHQKREKKLTNKSYYFTITHAVDEFRERMRLIN